ncbi:mannose-1-phosphate guanylyltransferase [Trueperella bialowiezensis]|uniref:mannose-1-phosphate guanylyltransferase n=1 Tax=Trueperella bialowiezensis TaxID=312285 RepID=A0A3S4VBM2_9ACTO|nr:mannose-1-phosphate guanylyltransferase [Trueperella bialowiezensis]VEI13927.1 Mannose-1-phosphate guanylyltransferase 1 [Trueperella bialowiezensis]
MIHAIIPAGGAGTRLWPLSRQDHPKFLTDLTGAGRTLIQQTVDRLTLISTDITVVTGAGHKQAVAMQLPEIAQHNIIAEPSPRDSMAAIALAVAVISQRHGDVVVGSFAADHLIRDEAAFHAAVRDAQTAAELGYLVTIGITPDHPATGFGYIWEGEPIDGTQRARAVRQFVEKPDASTAQRYLDTGQYRWNAGMFVAKASVLLGALERFEPELHHGVMEIARAYDTDERAEVLERVWPTLKKIAIDHAIAEPLADDGGVAVVPAEMGWSDVGDFASLFEVTGGDVLTAPGGTSQPVIPVDSAGSLIVTHSKPIAIVGVPGVVVVETEDAILVTTRDKAQGVKDAVSQLPQLGLHHLR